MCYESLPATLWSIEVRPYLANFSRVSTCHIEAQNTAINFKSKLSTESLLAQKGSSRYSTLLNAELRWRQRRLLQVQNAISMVVRQYIMSDALCFLWYIINIYKLNISIWRLNGQCVRVFADNFPWIVVRLPSSFTARETRIRKNNLVHNTNSGCSAFLAIH